MRNRKILLLLVLTGVIGLSSLAPHASAMHSTQYRLDWFVPLTGIDGEAESAGYTIQYTVGQSVVGDVSLGEWISLGYWPGITGGKTIYLPVVLLN